MAIYSQRLGEISDQQFQNAIDKFCLGKFIKATPITQGLFGQNVFITSSSGEYVLRGKPHYDWQFKNEKYMTDLLHAKTKVPVPYPYLLDTNTEIFGWEYAIMPKMKGRNLSDSLDESFLSDSDRLQIAQAQGEVLKEAQNLTFEYCGKYDLGLNNILPYKPDWLSEFTKQISDRLKKSAQYNNNTPDSDIIWANGVISQAANSIEDFEPTFYMQDFKPGNMVADHLDGVWKITGLFDLMEASFGHPEADISRMFAVYVERNRADLAYTFINAYLSNHVDIRMFTKRFPIFMFHDRSIIWEWAQRANRIWWNQSWTFRQYMNQFLSIDKSKIHL